MHFSLTGGAGDVVGQGRLVSLISWGLWLLILSRTSEVLIGPRCGSGYAWPRRSVSIG